MSDCERYTLDPARVQVLELHASGHAQYLDSAKFVHSAQYILFGMGARCNITTDAGAAANGYNDLEPL